MISALAAVERGVQGYAAELRAGAAAVELQAEDSMVIAGGIGPGYAKGQEGKLATAIVIQTPPAAKVAIISVDVLVLTRDIDPSEWIDIDSSDDWHRAERLLESGEIKLIDLGFEVKRVGSRQ